LNPDLSGVTVRIPVALSNPRVWLAVVAVALSLSPVVPSAAGAPASTVIPPDWSTPAAFDFAKHTYGRDLVSESCPSATLCVAGDDHGNVVTSTDPTGGSAAWSVTNLDTNGGYIEHVSCGSSSLCVAVDGFGDRIFTSTDPTGGTSAWAETDGLVDSFTNTSDRLQGISCPSASLCVAVDFDGSILYSTNPTGGASAWAKVPIAIGLEFMAISCPSTSLCVAVAWGGQVVTSTNPTGGASAWKVMNVTSAPDYLEQVACASESLCVALDAQGDAVSATDPTGDASAWKTTHIDDTVEQTGRVSAISCPSISLCVIGDGVGNVITSTDPTGDASAWDTADVHGSTGIPGLSCPSTTLCVAIGGTDGKVLTATDPTGAAPAWTASLVDPYVVNESDVPEGISCPSMDLCAVVDSYGNVVVSTNPVGGAATWSSSNVDGSNVLTGISCPTTALCVAVDEAGNVLTSTDPADATPTWTSASIDAANQLASVSCASETLCVAVDNAGNAFASTDPTGGAGDWTATDIDGSVHLNAVSCTPAPLCVTGDQTGQVIVSTDPTDASPTWTPSTPLPVSMFLESVSCPTASYCIAGDENGAVFRSTDPTGGAAAWTQVATDEQGGVFTASCSATSLCAFGDNAGNVFATADPAGSFLASSGIHVGGHTSVSCPSDRMCVAVTSTGYVSLGLNPPSVSLGPVESIGTTSATLTGTVNPNGFDVTDCHFAYGVGTMGGVPYKAPCNVLPGSGTSDVAVSATLTGLLPDTTYEYALYASNASGLTTSTFPSFTTLAYPAPDKHTLTVSLDPAADGNVTSSPAGIECGSICTRAFTTGTHITLTATATHGGFTGWTGGGCSGTGTCVVTLNSDTTVTAHFFFSPPPPPIKCLVATVKGKKLAAAESAIRRGNCAVGRVRKAYSAEVRKGRVISQTPRPGGTRPARTKVKLTVSKGKRPRK
jgi:hypothetical protein